MIDKTGLCVSVTVKDIEWDCDGTDPQKDCGLPKDTVVEIPKTMPTVRLHEAVAIRLHNRYGFNPVRFKLSME